MLTSNVGMMEKCVPCDLVHGIAVGARYAEISISETADLEFLHATISSVYTATEWHRKKKMKKKTKNVWVSVTVLWVETPHWSVRSKENGQIGSIITLYRCGEQKSISALAKHQTVRRMIYNSRRPDCVPFLSAKNNIPLLTHAQIYPNWTV